MATKEIPRWLPLRLPIHRTRKETADQADRLPTTTLSIDVSILHLLTPLFFSFSSFFVVVVAEFADEGESGKWRRKKYPWKDQIFPRRWGGVVSIRSSLRYFFFVKYRNEKKKTFSLSILSIKGSQTWTRSPLFWGGIRVKICWFMRCRLGFDQKKIFYQIDSVNFVLWPETASLKWIVKGQLGEVRLFTKTQ